MESLTDNLCSAFWVYFPSVIASIGFCYCIQSVFVPGCYFPFCSQSSSKQIALYQIGKYNSQQNIQDALMVSTAALSPSLSLMYMEVTQLQDEKCVLSFPLLTSKYSHQRLRWQGCVRTKCLGNFQVTVFFSSPICSRQHSLQLLSEMLAVMRR